MNKFWTELFPREVWRIGWIEIIEGREGYSNMEYSIKIIEKIIIIKRGKYVGSVSEINYSKRYELITAIENRRINV